MPRNPIMHNGVEYTFDHLQSFLVKVNPNDADYEAITLRVTYSHHVFTKSWEDGYPPPFTITEDNEIRTLCLDRYNWSKGLAYVIRYHVAGRAYIGRDSKGNYNNFFREQAQGRVSPYTVYFHITKATKLDDVDGILHIISAYENADLPPKSKFQSVTVRHLLGQTIGFKKVK